VGKRHGRTGRKKLAGRKEICPRCQKNFPGKLSKIVVDGGKWRSDYEKFLLDSIFPTKLTEFPTKLTEFVPFIFIISQYYPTLKRILPYWLCLPNKLGGAAAPPPGTPMESVQHPENIFENRERESAASSPDAIKRFHAYESLYKRFT
jgi:hypothetical protein